MNFGFNQSHSDVRTLKSTIQYFNVDVHSDQETTPCIMCVQYIGGCSVHWGDTMSTLGGYHEYIGGIS